VGVPNVGKSTLINNLKGRRVLVARNEPGVTRKGQAVRIDQGFYVWDTPGVLWPSLTDHDQLVRLAAIGTIPDAAIDVHDVAAFVLEYLARHYPDALRRTYGLKDLDRSPAVLLEDIGRLRGHVAPGGLFDSTRSARALIQDLRSGKLGRISVERPEAAGPQPAEESS
jgi:ribosome biogenesis GTPase A